MALLLHKLNVLVAFPVTMKLNLILLAALVSSILMSVKNGSNLIYFDGFKNQMSLSRTRSVDSVKVLYRF